MKSRFFSGAARTWKNRRAAASWHNSAIRTPGIRTKRGERLKVHGHHVGERQDEVLDRRKAFGKGQFVWLMLAQEPGRV